MGLMSSLGLDKVESDPNYLPDSVYKGVVKSDEVITYLKNKGQADEYEQVAHVITYQVTEGDRKGAQKPEFFVIGRDPQRGEPGNQIVGLTPTMTEQAKVWYKKRLEDLGSSNPNDPTPGDLTGTKVRFGIKKKDGYVNLSFVEKDDSAATPPPVQANLL